MDLNAFYWFVKVVEAKSMTKAAQIAGCAVSSISDRIKQLEKELNVRLLERSTRNLRLTEEGEAFYEQARSIVESAESARITVANMRSEPTGLLTVSVCPEFTRFNFWREFIYFAERYPKVKIRLLLDVERVNIVRDNFDLAIRMSFLEDNRLVARKLGNLKMVLVAEKSYLKSLKTPISTPADLAKANCIARISPLNGKTWPWIFTKGDVTETIVPKGNLDANLIVSGLDTALIGMGIAMIPQALLSEEDMKKLVYVLPEWQLPSNPAWAVYPNKNNLAPKARAFIDALQEGFAKQLHPNNG